MKLSYKSEISRFFAYAVCWNNRKSIHSSIVYPYTIVHLNADFYYKSSKGAKLMNLGSSHNFLIIALLQPCSSLLTDSL